MGQDVLFNRQINDISHAVDHVLGIHIRYDELIQELQQSGGVGLHQI